MCEDTPVEEVPAAPVSTTYKVIKDGRLWILYEGVWYDALGNRQE
jgi:hypothetical protein